MSFLSEGVKSPCLRGVLKIIVFDLGGKKLQIFVRRGSQKKVSEGGNIFRKNIRGGKIVKINCPRGYNGWKNLSERGKIAEKNCPRAVKSAGKTVLGGQIGQNCLGGGHKKKTCPRSVKKSCFVSEGVWKIPVFGQGVEKIPILSKGVTEIFLPLLFFLME